MTDLILSRRTSRPGFAARIVAALAALRTAHRIRREMTELADLPDHVRKDLGLPIDPDRAFLRQLGGDRWTPRDFVGW